MKENLISVESTSNSTIVINVPDLKLHRTFNKRGAKILVDRDTLEQAYFDPSVEFLIRNGYIVIHDKQFLIDMGIIPDEQSDSPIVVLDENMLNRLIKSMPLHETIETLKKLTTAQLHDLGDYAVEHYSDLKMEKLEVLTKATGKDLLNAIKNYKDAQE